MESVQESAGAAEEEGSWGGPDFVSREQWGLCGDAEVPLSSKYDTYQPDCGPSFQSKVLKTFDVVPCLLGGVVGRARLRLERSVGSLRGC